MSLAQLPPEIVHHIFTFVDPKFFREDLGRLTVSKWWYQNYAWPTFIRHVTLAASKEADSLFKFAQSKTLLPRIRPDLTALVLRLAFHRTTSPSAGTEAIAAAERDEWIARTETSLTDLAGALQECTRLRNLNLRVLVIDACPLATALSALVSLPHLTSLNLDAAHSGRLGKRGDPEHHFCLVVSALLPTLQCLKCRLDCICESILEPPGQSGGALLPLRDLRIIVGRWVSGRIKRLAYARHCPSAAAGTREEILPVMQRAVRALVPKLKSPRAIRLLDFHGDPLIFDALKRQWMYLEPGDSWDADRDVLEDQQPRIQGYYTDDVEQ